jgi:hypothetical protein
MAEEDANGLLWENSGISVSILSSEAQITTSTFRVLVSDQESATLQLTGESIPFSLILDLRSTVTRQVLSSSEGRFIYKFFYDRFDCHAEIDFTLSGADEHRDMIGQSLEFILRQYTLYATEEETLSEERRRPNVVAIGFEGVGVGFRTALRSGGRSTGHAIRYLGKMYTSSTIGDSVDREKKVIDQSQIRKAEGHHANAETCHAGARTLTSAALAPVRWIGKSASKLAPKTSSSDRGVTRVVHDTIGGMGNGVANVCKVHIHTYNEKWNLD